MGSGFKARNQRFEGSLIMKQHKSPEPPYDLYTCDVCNETLKIYEDSGSISQAGWNNIRVGDVKKDICENSANYC